MLISRFLFVNKSISDFDIFMKFFGLVDIVEFEFDCQFGIIQRLSWGYLINYMLAQGVPAKFALSEVTMSNGRERGRIIMTPSERG